VGSRRYERFIDRLSRIELSERACNQYSRVAGDLRGNAIRRRNLRLYFSQLESIGPRAVLIGEAPSYRGGRLTGIAFVSEAIMLAGVPFRDAGTRLLGADCGYRKATTGPRLSTEASATIVWGTIRNTWPPPILWNAFPFHPFEKGDPDTNRLPTAGELEIGQPFIATLIELFALKQVIAVGNQASRSLGKMGIDHAKVRHPSQGGKEKFVSGLRQLLGS
jgi:uracil-DNA glycosylase